MKYVILSILFILFITTCTKKEQQIDPTLHCGIESKLSFDTTNVSRGQKITVCILIDTDGYGFYSGCEITPEQVERALNICRWILARYAKGIVFTTEQSVFDQYPIGRKAVCSITNSGIGFLGASTGCSLLDGDIVNPALVWYYGVLNNIAPITDDEVIARIIVHEIIHTLCYLTHELEGIMKGYPHSTGPFNQQDGFLTPSVIKHLDRILKR